MKMRVVKADSTAERLLAVGMITSGDFLKRIEAFYDHKLLDSKYVREVAAWAWAHWKKYGKPIDRHIQDVYAAEERSGAMDDELAESIGDFLASLSAEYERADRFNVGYVVDQVERMFRARRIRTMSEDALAYLSQDRLEEAEDAVSGFRLKTATEIGGTNPLTDRERIIDAFEKQTEPLFRFPGPFGQLINEHLVRDGFLGIMGPEKRGKTFNLVEFGVQALKARCNVAFFEVGDMSEAQIYRRLHIRLAGKSDKMKYCGEFLSPVLDCALNQDDSCSLPERTSPCGIKDGDTLLKFEDAPADYRPCIACLKKRFREGERNPYQGAVWHERRHIPKPLTGREAVVVGEKWRKRVGGREMKLVAVPSNSLNVRGIDRYLDGWEAENGFVPDVIIIDYADILAPEESKGGLEPRYVENERWKALRSLSQRRHALVIVATQADAASFDAHTIGMKNFSEDKRKYGHVTGMLGLNQTPEEKRAGIMRYNWVVLREGDYDISKTVSVLQSLRTGQPHLGSFWG